MTELEKVRAVEAVHALVQKGRLDRAQEALGELVNAFPSDPVLHTEAGDLFARREKKREAVASYGRAVDIHWGAGYFAKAISVVRAALRVYPDAADWWIELAELSHRQALPADEANLAYQKALELIRALPGGVDAYVQRARETARREPELEPSIRMRLGGLFQALGKFGLSEPEFLDAYRYARNRNNVAEQRFIGERILGMDPCHEEVAIDVAHLYLEDASPNEALTTLKALVAKKRHEDNEEILGLLIRAFEETRKKAPFVKVLKQLARLHERHGQLERAREEFGRVLSVVSDDLDAQAFLSRGYSGPVRGPGWHPSAESVATAVPTAAGTLESPGTSLSTKVPRVTHLSASGERVAIEGEVAHLADLTEEDIQPKPAPKASRPSSVVTPATGPTQFHHVDERIEARMPVPIARAWRMLGVAEGAAGQSTQAISTFNVILRTVATVVLVDYLRGESSPHAEAEIQKLGRPAEGDWAALIRDCIRQLSRRSQPTPFMPEAIGWYFDAKGKPTEAGQWLSELVALRNELSHKGTSLQVTQERTTKFIDKMRRLLATLDWLGAYRPMRTIEDTVTRGGRHQGRVQLFSGVEESPKPVSSEWDHQLFRSAIYLLNPEADGVMEISPFWTVAPHAGAKEERLFLFRDTDDFDSLRLAHDGSGETFSRRAEIGDEEVSFRGLLERRIEVQSVHSFKDYSGLLNAPRQSSVGDLGKVLGNRFEVRDVLGEGGMAVVNAAFDRERQIEVALKVIHPRLAGDWTSKNRFKREADVLRSLEHENIIRIYDDGVLADQRMYLSMPVVRGGSLADWIERGPVAPGRVKQWAVQIVTALRYLHSQGVVHRDLKPSNCLLEGETVLLADFGISLVDDVDAVRLTQAHEQVGSRAWMAPEQNQGSRVGPPADVFSLALVLHQLLEGRREPPPAAGKHIPDPWGKLLQAMGAQSPEERPNTTAILRDLDCILE